MARPKLDGSPTADTRIEAAFFDVLETTPFEKITVSAVVQAAGVNRNSFYYHFADLEDLAQSAVANVIIPEVPRLLASGFAPSSPELDEVFDRATASTGSLRRVPLILGPNSTAALRNILKQAMRELWLESFDVAPSALDPSTTATVEFALGGILEVLSTFAPHTDFTEHLREFRQLPIVQSTYRAVAGTLEAANSASQPS